MDLKNIIRKVIKEAHEKKLLNEEPKSVDVSKYNNLNFKDYVVGSSTPSKDKINPSLLSDINTAAGIAGTKASVTTAVTGHKKGTRHGSGLAVDVAMFDGKGYSGIESAKANGIYDKITRFVRALESMGYKVNSESGNDKAVLWFGFKNHHHHVHISRKSDNGTSATEKPVEKGKSAEYLDYQLKSGKLYNPSNVKIGKVKELILKGNDGEKIFGFRRIDDKRVYLFKYETLDNVKYLEMNWPTFENYAKELVNGKWGKITKNAAIGGVVDKEIKTEPKSSEEKKSDTPKNDGKTPTNLIIGDSQTPYVDSQTSKAQMISGPEGQTTLHKSGWSVDDLKNAVKKYPKSENVENVFLCIGTNGGYGDYKNDIGGLFDAVKETFPNAKIHVIQGSWGWGGVSKYNENDVRSYYKKYEAMGASLIEPPIGKIEPHGQKPVYKLIGAAIDSKI